MKITDLLKHTRIDEAPLGDYQTIGNWGDKEKANSFAHQSDRRIIQHPKTMERLRDKFGNTEHVLNLYFVNQPGMRKYTEIGVVEPDFIAQAMPNAWPEIEARGKDGVDHENGINVIFVGNAGVNRMPMTPWIMAHRISHALARTPNRDWVEYEQETAAAFTDLLKGVYDMTATQYEFWFGSNSNSKMLAKFFEGIGGMRSARKGQLGGRHFEFQHEMFAQFVTTGRLTFRPCPESFGIRGEGFYHIQNQDVADMWDRDLNDVYGDQIGNRIDNTLYSVEGKFLVM
jgi:hypothetical protein